MELGVDSHPGPGIYAYYLGPYYAELLDIGTSYPIRATTVARGSPSITHLQAHRRYLCHVMIWDGSSSWNSLSSLYTPTAPNKAYDDHIRDTVILVNKGLIGHLSLQTGLASCRGASGASSGCDSLSLALLPLSTSDPLAFRLGGRSFSYQYRRCRLVSRCLVLDQNIN
ncbi:UNVERIFIED_CONTAM: hypothetical protein Slati_0179600 [Sesamum latifolium]|uniref:Uncharacterized protein n=1 Tax=Sesamum latifolium TaxID=2727402 RepID=A0AAW2YB60_9LAMI